MEIKDNSFSGVFANKKVLVTGNTGFKGSWLTSWLIKLGAEVIGYSKDIPTKPSMFKELKLENEIKQYYADVKDRSLKLIAGSSVSSTVTVTSPQLPGVTQPPSPRTK